MSAVAAMDTATDVISVDFRRACFGQILRTDSALIIACGGGVDGAFLLAEFGDFHGDFHAGLQLPMDEIFRRLMP